MGLAEIAEQSARGGFSLMVGTAASTVVNALGVIVIARLLGPAGYGSYILVFVFPTLFASIADLGLSPTLARYAASLRSQQKPRSLASMLRSGLFLNLTGGSVGFLVCLASSGRLAADVLHRPEIGGLVAIASLSIVFQGALNLSSNTFVGLDRMEKTAEIVVLRDTARPILAVSLILAGLGVAGAITGQVSGWILAGLVAIGLLLGARRSLQKASGNADDYSSLREDMRVMMRYGLPLYSGNLLAVLLTQYQNIVLSFFTSNTDVGNFSAVVNFGALIGIVATPVATALFPAFSKLDLQTRKMELQRVFELSVKYTGLLVLPVAVAVAALSKDLIRALYGAAYAYASAYLVLYMCIFSLSAFGYYVISNFLNGVGRTRETLRIILVQLAVFLPAAPVLTWLCRVPGLIIALVLSSVTSIGFGLWLATRKYGMRVDLKGSLATVVAALVSAIPILPLYYSPLPSLANVLIGGAIYLVVYITLAPIFRAIQQADLEVLGPALEQIKILRPVTHMIFRYETWLLIAIEQHTPS